MTRFFFTLHLKVVIYFVYSKNYNVRLSVDVGS